MVPRSGWPHTHTVHPACCRQTKSITVKCHLALIKIFDSSFTNPHPASCLQCWLLQSHQHWRYCRDTQIQVSSTLAEVYTWYYTTFSIFLEKSIGPLQALAKRQSFVLTTALETFCSMGSLLHFLLFHFIRRNRAADWAKCHRVTPPSHQTDQITALGHIRLSAALVGVCWHE